MDGRRTIGILYKLTYEPSARVSYKKWEKKLKNSIFTFLINCCILHRHVFVINRSENPKHEYHVLSIGQRSSKEMKTKIYLKISIFTVFISCQK